MAALIARDRQKSCFGTVWPWRVHLRLEGETERTLRELRLEAMFEIGGWDDVVLGAERTPIERSEPVLAGRLRLRHVV